MRKGIIELVKSYASLATTSILVFPLPCTDELQEEIIEQLISSKHFQTYPPAPSYQRLFWKWLIKCIEDLGEEVNEAIYSHYLSLPSSSNSALVSCTPPPPSYVTYFWQSNTKCNGSSGTLDYQQEGCLEKYNKCTLFEHRTTIESGTTGFRTWSASFTLAEYLISKKESLGRSQIIELGSGIGFLGIVVARLQIESLNSSIVLPSNNPDELPSLYLTDLNERVLSRCEDNCNLPCNNISSHPFIRFKSLDWSDAMDESRKSEVLDFLEEANADLFLGADLIYDSSIIPSLVSMLALALRSSYPRPSTSSTSSSSSPSISPSPSSISTSNKKHRRCLLAATLRNENTLAEFIQEADTRGLRVEEVRNSDTGLSQFSGSLLDRIGEKGSQVKILSVVHGKEEGERS